MTGVTETTGRGAQPRQLIVTVYGLYSRGAGGWMSIASLVSLLGDLGIDEPAVRSSISRLKRRGILVARRLGGAAGSGRGGRGGGGASGEGRGGAGSRRRERGAAGSRPAERGAAGYELS